MIRALLLWCVCLLAGPPTVAVEVSWWHGGACHDAGIYDPDGCHDPGVQKTVVVQVDPNPTGPEPPRVAGPHWSAWVLVFQTNDGQWLALGTGYPSTDWAVAKSLGMVRGRWVHVEVPVPAGG